MSNPVIVNSVLYHADKNVAEWVAQRLPARTAGRVASIPQNMVCALGVVRDRKLVAGVIFHDFHAGLNIECSVASDNAKWCLPETLRQLFSYPFIQLQVPRLTCTTSIKNKRSRRLITGLGWKLEGTIRRAFDGHKDLMVYGMLPHECRFLKTRTSDGQQRHAISAAAA